MDQLSIAERNRRATGHDRAGRGRRLPWVVVSLGLLGSACVTTGITATPVEGVRASAGGEISQATRVGGGGRDEVSFADCAADGSLTVFGDTYGSVGDSYELLAARLGPNRRLERATTLGRGNKEQLVRARRTADGGFLLLANSVSQMLSPFPTMGRPIPLVVKVSATAAPEWSVLVGRTERQVIYGLTDLALAEDGGAVFVGGLVQAPDFKAFEPAIVKLDAVGHPVWSRRLLLGSPGLAEAVAALPGGDLVVAGAVEQPDGPAGPKLGMLVVRIAPDGTPRWARKVSLAGHVLGAKRVAATDDGFVVLGQAGGGGALDLVALSFSPNGTLAWAWRYTDPQTRHANPLALAVDATGDLLLAGSSGEAPKVAAVVLVAGRDGTLKLATTLGEDLAARVTSVQPLGAGRICVALTTEGLGRDADILTATWTPPAAAGASRFHAAPLELRVSEVELRGEPLVYQHARLPAGSLIERALDLPALPPAATAGEGSGR